MLQAPSTAQAGPTSITTRFPHSISSTTHPSNTADLEPDEEGKRQLKRKRLNLMEYKTAMASNQAERLEQERNQRRWPAGELEQGGRTGIPLRDREEERSPMGPPTNSINHDNRRREGWERPDREALWGDDHGHQASGRERAWERDRDPYPNAGGHPSQYVYGALQRYGSYPTPPESPNRHGGRDYFPMSALYDSREPGPPSRVYSYGNYAPPLQSTPPEEYDNEEYHRQKSVHVMPPTRQMSYWGRESGDRRLEDLG
jgi:hypothetical protein